MELIVISNDPISGLKRKLKYKFQWDPFEKYIKIFTVIYYCDSDGNILDNSRFKLYEVILTADNSTNIGTEENPIGEYDYWFATYGSSPVILPEVLAGIIAQRDSQNRFDV